MVSYKLSRLRLSLKLSLISDEKLLCKINFAAIHEKTKCELYALVKTIGKKKTGLCGFIIITEPTSYYF